MEACLESFPQIVIQLFYFIKLNFTFKDNYLLLFSLIFSIYSVCTRITKEDKIYFVQTWKNSEFKCGKTKSKKKKKNKNISKWAEYLPRIN